MEIEERHQDLRINIINFISYIKYFFSMLEVVRCTKYKVVLVKVPLGEGRRDTKVNTLMLNNQIDKKIITSFLI